MVDGFCVLKGAVPAQLLKPPHVMEQTGQPGPVGLFFRQGNTAGNLLAEGRHPVGVVDLQPHFRVGGVVGTDVFGKRTAGAVTVKGHGGTFLSCIRDFFAL